MTKQQVTAVLRLGFPVYGLLKNGGGGWRRVESNTQPGWEGEYVISVLSLSGSHWYSVRTVPDLDDVFSNLTCLTLDYPYPEP